jgi:hypothetical protein
VLSRPYILINLLFLPHFIDFPIWESRMKIIMWVEFELSKLDKWCVIAILISTFFVKFDRFPPNGFKFLTWFQVNLKKKFISNLNLFFALQIIHKILLSEQKSFAVPTLLYWQKKTTKQNLGCYFQVDTMHLTITSKVIYWNENFLSTLVYAKQGWEILMKIRKIWCVHFCGHYSRYATCFKYCQGDMLFNLCCIRIKQEINSKIIHLYKFGLK